VSWLSGERVDDPDAHNELCVFYIGQGSLVKNSAANRRGGYPPFESATDNNYFCKHH